MPYLYANIVPSMYTYMDVGATPSPMATPPLSNCISGHYWDRRSNIRTVPAKKGRLATMHSILLQPISSNEYIYYRYYMHVAFLPGAQLQINISTLGQANLISCFSSAPASTADTHFNLQYCSLTSGGPPTLSHVRQFCSTCTFDYTCTYVLASALAHFVKWIMNYYHPPIHT